MINILAHAMTCKTFSPALDFAADLSVVLNASLTGLYSAQIVVPMAVIDAPVFMNDVTEALLVSRDNACAAGPAFTHWASGRGVGKCTWQVVEGVLDEALAIAGDWHDFVILQSGAGSAWTSPDALGDLIVTIGHPCLIAPPDVASVARLQCIAVAWNGSRGAVRAVHAALPLLRRATRIVVFKPTADDSQEGWNWHPPFDLEAYLASHGLRCSVEPFDATDDEVGVALLERAKDIAADMIVMGAYGRSRLSERMLGGATRHLLNHAHIPLFMCH
ncbi:MAG: universal stress protein [Dokdonella sp.]|uniref:universal stress protein n=1 Tax=Dokdonella sp. TaxID=2291710 RepID=UPI003265F9F1